MMWVARVLVVLVAVLAVIPHAQATSSSHPLKQALTPTKRFAIFQTGELPDELMQKYPGGYASFFLKWLSNPENSHEHWDVFKVFEGVDKFPSPADMLQYTAVVITGSKFDADSPDPWAEELRQRIKTMYKHKVRMFGICFGSQIISRALGGDSGRAEAWELGMKKIIFKRKGVLKNVPLAHVHYEMESHRDHITKLPPQAVHLAWSPNNKYEMWQLPASHPTVLVIQFHPEFDEQYIQASFEYKKQAHVVPAAAADEALVSMKHFDEMRAQPNRVQANGQAIRDLLKRFVRDGL